MRRAIFALTILLAGFAGGIGTKMQKMHSQKKAKRRDDPKIYQIAQKPLSIKSNKQFVFLVMSYNNENFYEKNLSSLFDQTYPHYRILYIDDDSKDNTYELVKDYITDKGMEDKTTLIRNETNFGAMKNLYLGIHSCRDDEIVVVVDGDDWLPNEHVLDQLNHYYQNPDVWLTYSNHLEYPAYHRGSCSRPIKKEVFQKGTIRTEPWATSHLRTFYAGLFKQIKKEDFQYKGKFYPTTYDLACMFPMVELAAEHTYFLPEIMYIYNMGNPLNDCKVNTEKQRFFAEYISALPKYSPMSSPPFASNSLAAR